MDMTDIGYDNLAKYIGFALAVATAEIIPDLAVILDERRWRERLCKGNTVGTQFGAVAADPHRIDEPIVVCLNCRGLYISPKIGEKYAGKSLSQIEAAVEKMIEPLAVHFRMRDVSPQARPTYPSDDRRGKTT